MHKENVDLSQFQWLNEPRNTIVTETGVEFDTLPETDFWQRTHYGFQRTDGHAFMTRLWDDFSFSAGADSVYETLFDQSGLLLWVDEDNWAKVSLENGPGGGTSGMLGSVVTINGYSDWSTTTLDPIINPIWYRISRRGSDFRFDSSLDGDEFTQMRIFHMHGDLTHARVGVYACSPGDSSFHVRFTEITAGPSVWKD